jgi:hypothetical protein
MDLPDSTRWEVGSVFHWEELPACPALPWPEPVVWYMLARHAVLALLRRLGGVRALWLPSFFCHDITGTWSALAEIRYYEDNPRRPHPDWRTLTPAKNDVVLAVNYFGMGEGTAWAEWSADHRCLLLEDHSHDPHSEWARASRADYAFSSLRKMFPVPDGAILWSPRGHELPVLPPWRYTTGASGKLAALLYKSDYLAGRGTAGLKEAFRRLQIASETQMELEPMLAPSPATREYLAEGAPSLWRALRRNNARRLAERLAHWKQAEPLFLDIPEGAAPLGFPLLFSTAESRIWYRECLQRHDVYCPVHWPAPPFVSAVTRKLADRILTIPSDQRYRVRDMDRIADILCQTPPEPSPA